MEDFLAILFKALISVLDFVLFFFVSLLFLPSFLIVNNLQGYWTKKLGDFFGL